MTAYILLLFALRAFAMNEYVASTIVSSSYGITADLTYTGSSTSSQIVQKLFLNITYESADYARIRVTDPSYTRWEVPNVVMNNPPVTNDTIHYTVVVSRRPFGVTVLRKSDNSVIFNLTDFQYNNLDIIWGSHVGSPISVFGLGERVSSFKLAEGQYTLYSKDFAGTYDSGELPGKNMYSSQPIYLAMNNVGDAFGGFLLNSNPMQAYVNKTGVVFRPIGGIIDYFAYLGPTPLDVIKQHQRLTGYPGLTPYWSLGWHHCRWGYHSLTELEEVAQNYTMYGIPFDSIWADIDYMISNRDFTVDNTRFNLQLFQTFIQDLHKKDRRFIPIVDAGIPNITYTPYTDGLDMNVFIQSPHYPGPFVGKVWPGLAVFVDWFNPNATTYWHKTLGDFKLLLDFDGIWCDMNEASNFCDGECDYNPVIDDLPFTPGETDLNIKSIDLAASHHNGILEFNAHNLFGKMMAEATSSYFEDVLKKRPFVLSRSAYPGSQKYAIKWLGDNYSSWDYLTYSIVGSFDYQIFGVPLIGADICGFLYDATEELCARWYQLGSLYPFSRHHNEDEARPQEPWAFGATLLQASNNAIRTKYSLINYYYTQVFLISQDGGTFFQPAFFEYPTDNNLINYHNSDNFMLGSALIVHPCLKESQTTVEAYFPSDIWYNWYTGKALSPGTRTTTLDAPLRGYINIHIRGGYIVPMADNYLTASTIQELRYSNISLVLAANGNGSADGQIVFDDGEGLDTISEKKYTLISYRFTEESKNKYTLEVIQLLKGYERAPGEWPNISSVNIYDCGGEITSVKKSSDNTELMVSSGYNRYTKVCWVYLTGVVPDEKATFEIEIK